MIGPLWKLVVSPLLRINAAEVGFRRRGFQTCDLAKKTHLESVGIHFLTGYHLALDKPIHVLEHALSQLPPQYRGFAFEGAAMSLALLDLLSGGRGHKWHDFVDGPGAAHRYVCHVGYGWVLARLPWTYYRPERCLGRFDPLLRWLVLDGFGFHEGYFHWRKWLPPSIRRVRWGGYAAQVFDQGLGRSLWFVAGADVIRVSQLIARFPVDRRADLWSGIGLACAYAGSPTVPELEYLIAAAGKHAMCLGQGVLFGAEARELAGIPTDHTDLACMVVCGLSASAGAKLTHSAKQGDLIDSNESPAYEAWRSNIRQMLHVSDPKVLGVL